MRKGQNDVWPLGMFPSHPLLYLGSGHWCEPVLPYGITLTGNPKETSRFPMIDTPF